MLDLRRLRLLRELHERGTIAAVADALQFTPSAVSQQLALLERGPGVRLLGRAGAGARSAGSSAQAAACAGRIRRWCSSTTPPRCSIARPRPRPTWRRPPA